MIRRTDGSEWLDEDTATALKVEQELERKPLLAIRHTSGKRLKPRTDAVSTRKITCRKAWPASESSRNYLKALLCVLLPWLAIPNHNNVALRTKNLHLCD